MNLRMNRGELGIRGNVVGLNEDNLYKKDYFRDDWTSRKWFRTDLRQFLQEEEGHVYTFTNAGNLRQVTYTRQGNDVASTRCGYAKNGLLTSFLGEGYKIEGKYKNNSGEFNVYAEARSYSGKADLATANLKTADYKTDYPFAYKCRQQLSSDGLVLKSSYYNVDSTLARQTEYTYSATGQIVVQRNKSFNADGKPAEFVTSYTYDGHGLLIHKETRGAGGTDSYTYTNNAMGDCVEMQAEHPYGTETFTYQYEYDDNGNWTMRLTFKDNVFDYATLRALTYGKGAKDKAEDVEQEDAPADGDAYYNTYDATAAHEAAKAAKSGKKRFSLSKKKKEAQSDAAVDKSMDAKASSDKASATKSQKKAERKELEQRAKQIKKEAGQTTKEKAKAQTKADKKAAKVAGKEAVKQAKAQAKSERKQADKVAADKAKAMKQAAAASQKASQKEARAAAKAHEKAAKVAAKKASQQAKEAADEASRKAKQSAEETEKAAVKQAKEQAKQQQQTEEKMAKMAAKADKAQAKMEEKAAKKAAKEAQKQAVKEARKAK